MNQANELTLDDVPTKSASRTAPIKLFLVGCPRSGTTLLQSLLTGAGGLYTLKETHFFRHVQRWRPLRRLDRWRLDPKRASHALAFITQNNDLEGHYPSPPSRLDEACALLDRMLTSEAAIRGRAGWLEKTPEHMFFIPEIRRHIPDAQFVHILRDGTDVIASLYDARRKYPDAWGWLGELDDMIRLYNRYLRVTRREQGRADTFVVRYRDLVTRDEAVLAALADFVGLPPDVLTPDDVDAGRSDLVRPDEPWKRRMETGIVNTSGEKFAKLFSMDQQALVQRQLLSSEALVSG